ncbi:MAG TPA: DUF2721 domain-containing protein [Adhaeribacter sp.]|nr:DUF2721 domain-containing protein [Adhaeribacter sp.]
METLSSALTILSAMITPAVLILASGSLSLTTSQRLSRSIDRVRKMSEKLGELNAAEEMPEFKAIERAFLMQQLTIAARRSRLLQRAMTTIYIALTIFVAAILTIGALELFGLGAAWLLILLGFTGVALVFYACIMLILESRLALRSVNKEMDFTLTYYVSD